MIYVLNHDLRIEILPNFVEAFILDWLQVNLQQSLTIFVLRNKQENFYCIYILK